MTEIQKQNQLKKYKFIATGLFILMAGIFISMILLQKTNESHWIGYVKAFSEAAMVGALADWFAVTALFHHPLGLKIPHTNLIQNKKEQIGGNLGNFVVENFLSPQNIRPYIVKINISKILTEWILKEKNQIILMDVISKIILDILNKIEDKAVVNFISNKAKDLSENLKLNHLVSNSLNYILNNNEHQTVITEIASQIKNYVLSNQNLVRERVKKESFILIPQFIDNNIADKITVGISKYFEEVERNNLHPLREEISQKLYHFSKELRQNIKWEEKLSAIKNEFLNDEKIHQYSSDIWKSLKISLSKELIDDGSSLRNYIKKNLEEFSEKLSNDEKLQNKINHWIRVLGYKYILKNTHHFKELISSTIGNWEGKELSNKLELEVGKDLQFIRINGTVVGGLVGLIIYTISEILL